MSTYFVSVDLLSSDWDFNDFCEQDSSLVGSVEDVEAASAAHPEDVFVAGFLRRLGDAPLYIRALARELAQAALDASDGMSREIGRVDADELLMSSTTLHLQARVSRRERQALLRVFRSHLGQCHGPGGRVRATSSRRRDVLAA